MRRKILLSIAMLAFTLVGNAQNAWINELHYDNTSGDVGEFIEVVIENSGSYTLSDFEVYKYNGSNGTTYGDNALDAFTEGVTVGGFTLFTLTYPANGLQNGGPDGVALVYQGVVISGQFLSYEGVFAATDGPVFGITSTNIGVSETGSTPIGQSLQLSGTGSAYINFTWQSPAVETPGLENNSQNIGAPTTDPLITVSTASLTGFSYIIGNGPSDEQSFTVEGSDLTADITLTPPTNYEVSLLTGGAFAPTNPITLTQSGGAVSSTTIYTRLKAGLSAADYDGEDITASSAGATVKTVTCSGSVEAPASTTLPYEENFDTDLGDCYTYSVTGDTKNWYWSSGYAKMNGYNSGEVEEDWLILPGIDFDGSYDYMRFDTWNKYGTDDENNYLKLMYSTDYSGLGDPALATWTEISFTQPSSTETWTSSGNIWLSEIPGPAYIAFKYHYEAGSYKSWQVDNISIHEAPPVPLGSTGIIIAVLLISAVLIIRRGKLI